MYQPNCLRAMKQHTNTLHVLIRPINFGKNNILFIDEDVQPKEAKWMSTIISCIYVG